jgi:hypothetical protein
MGANMVKLCFVLSVVIFIFGCSMNVQANNEATTDLKKVEALDTPFAIAKVQYYPQRDTYYIWEKNTSNIHIYRNGKEINMVGGLGFARENFQRLSDIGVGVDGGLYGLDQLSRKLKKFDPVGTWLLDYDVSWTQEPTKFALDQTNQIILFDDIQREFFFSSDLRPEETFEFGKFQVTAVKQITIEGNLLVAYEPEPKQTSFFTLLGEFKETRQGQMINDMYGNLYRLDQNYITFIPSNQTGAASIDPYESIFIADPYILTTTDHQIQRWLINYVSKP